MCDPEPSGGPSLLQAAGVVVGAAVGVAVLRFAESIAAVILLAVYVPCAVCIAALVRNLRPVRVKRAAVNHTVMRAALPAPRRMLEQAQPGVYVITDARERISR